MKYLPILILFFAVTLLSSCSRKKHYEKGFSVGPESETLNSKHIDGLSQDSATIKTRPSGVLLTGFSEYRLTTIYKLNYDERDDDYYTGSNQFYRNYSEIGYTQGNQWNYNFMPGLQAVYGYNLVNVSLRNVSTQKQKQIFDDPVLIKTLYYPSFTKDTLFNQPIKRNYYLMSVYNEDTNRDGYINLSDLRRLYYFDINGENKQNLIPINYSVMSSEYDCVNDFMYVFAQLDENKNGQRDDTEEIHVFWIDLNNPKNHGKQYE